MERCPSVFRARRDDPERSDREISAIAGRVWPSSRRCASCRSCGCEQASSLVIPDSGRGGMPAPSDLMGRGETAGADGAEIPAAPSARKPLQHVSALRRPALGGVARLSGLPERMRGIGSCRLQRSPAPPSSRFDEPGQSVELAALVLVRQFGVAFRSARTVERLRGLLGRGFRVRGPGPRLSLPDGVAVPFPRIRRCALRPRTPGCW